MVGVIQVEALSLGIWIEVSILVVMDGWGDTNWMRDETSCQASFQSLLWWMVGVIPNGDPGVLQRGGVSILVVMDGWGDTQSAFIVIGGAERFNPCCDGWLGWYYNPLYRLEIDAKFQSLLWWMVGVILCCFWGGYCCCGVSILVVMDGWGDTWCCGGYK